MVFMPKIKNWDKQRDDSKGIFWGNEKHGGIVSVTRDNKRDKWRVRLPAGAKPKENFFDRKDIARDFATTWMRNNPD